MANASEVGEMVALKVGTVGALPDYRALMEQLYLARAERDLSVHEEYEFACQLETLWKALTPEEQEKVEFLAEEYKQPLKAAERLGRTDLRASLHERTGPHAFTRFMMAMDARREEQLRALEEAKENREKDAEERAKDSATREEKADHRAHEALLRDRRQEARERLAQRVSRNETHWIKWATLVIAAAAVGQVAAASLQALAAFRPQSPATCTCASPAMPAPR